MRINGIPFPSDMTLTDFFKKVREGQTNNIAGLLANPNFTEDNGRLDSFVEGLDPDYLTEIPNPEDFTISTNPLHIIDSINNATYGNEQADAYSKLGADGDMSGTIFEDIDNAYNKYGLPLWFAKLKGLVK